MGFDHLMEEQVAKSRKLTIQRKVITNADLTQGTFKGISRNKYLTQQTTPLNRLRMTTWEREAHDSQMSRSVY